MADSNSGDTSNNEELNDATEQVSTDTTTSGTSGTTDNRQSTVSNTVATGSTTADIEEAESNLTSSDASTTTNSDETTDTDNSESADTSAPTSSDSQSNNVESVIADDETTSNTGDVTTSESADDTSQESTGAQSVGGTESDSSTETATSSSTAESPSGTSETSSEAVTETSEGATSTESDSTTTNSETFEVNVGQDNNSDGQVDADDIPLSDETDNSMTFEVNVTAENDAPTAVDKSFTLQEDGVLTFTANELLSGATDIDGDSLSIESVSYTGADGVLTTNEDGSYSFAPNENFNGEINLSFAVSDGTDSVDANIGLVVEGVNDAPVAGATSYNVDEDGVLTFSETQLLANSSDIDGVVSLDSVSYSGSDGILTNNGNGTFDFSPNENFNGSVSLDIVVIDEEGASDTTTAGIDVIAVNDTPVVSGNLAYSVDEDGAITFSQEQLLANASDVDGDTLSAFNLSANDSTVVDNGDGSFTISPDENFNGEISLSFDISDPSGEIVGSSVDLTVNSVNDGPIANDDGNVGSLSLDGDDALHLGVGNNDAGGQVTSMWIKIPEDAEGDQGLFSIQAANGATDRSLTINEDGQLESSVWAGAHGTETTTTSGTDLSDGEWHHVVFSLGASGTDLYVDGELAGEGNFGSSSFNWSEFMTLGENSDGNNLTGEIRDFQTYTNFGATQDDVDALYAGDTLEATRNTEPQFRMQFEENQEFVVEGSNADMINGVPTLVGNPEVIQSLEGTVVAADDVVTNFDVLSNDSDLEGDVSITGLSDVVDADGNILGTLNIVEVDGIQQVQFMPDSDALALPAGEQITGQFSYTITDEDGATDTANVAFQYEGTNNTPEVSENIAASVSEDGTLTLTQADLLANASDIDGDNLSASNLSINEGGSASIVDNGDGTYSVTPDANFNGDISFSFDVSDGQETVSTGVDVSVTAVNDLPITSDLSATVAEDSSITVTQADLLANASDVDGDSLTAENLQADNAIISDNGDGTFTINPDPNFNGEIDVSFDINDGTGTTPGSLNLDVTNVNDAAVVEDQSFSVDEDGTLTITDDQLLSGASDIDAGDSLSVADVSYTGTDGVFADNGDGTYSFAPNENFNGEISGEDLSFSVSDGTVTTDANIDITVNDINDAPVAGSTSYSVDEDGTLNFSDAQLLANSSDVDGTMSVDSVGYSGTDGVFTDNGDGTYSFAPNENFNGDVSIDVAIVDDDGATDTTTADVTVNDINDSPVAGGTTYSVAEDGTLTFSDAQLLANSSDVDGTVSVDSVTYTGSDGVLTDNGDGTYDFAPNTNFNGDVSIDVQVIDDDGATASASADVSVMSVNDEPVIDGSQAYSVDEDGNITLSQEQLLSNASDVEGDILTASNVSAGEHASVTDNGDGSFTINPDANFSGDVSLSFDVSDGTDVVSSAANVTVGAIVDAADIGLTGGLLDIEMVANGGDNHSESWAFDGEANDDYYDSLYFGAGGDHAGGTAEQSIEGGVEGLTYTVEFDQSHIGSGTSAGRVDIIDDATGDVIATHDYDNTGHLNAEHESFDFTLQDSGSFSIRITNVQDGAQTDHTVDNVSIQALSENNADFTNGADVVLAEDGSANLNLSVSSADDDGSETVSSIELSGLPEGSVISDGSNTATIDETGNADVTAWSLDSLDFTPPAQFNGDVALMVTATTEELGSDAAPVVTSSQFDLHVVANNDEVEVSGNVSASVDEDGSFTLTQGDLLANASDIDGDDLTASNLSVENATIVDNGDGSFTVSPDANFNGELDITYDISDGNGSIVQSNVDVTVNSVNDLPTAPTINLDGTEDVAITIDPAYIISQAGDIDGDNLTLDNLSVRQPANASLTQNQDGTFSLTTPENFNGLIDLAYAVSDGQGESVEGSLNMDIIPVDDAPFQQNNAHLTTEEDGEITFSSDDLQNLFGDVDSSVTISRVITAEGDEAEGEVVDNGDGTWTFVPTADFAGTTGLQVVSTDGNSETTIDLPVYIRPVADGTVITTDHEGPLVFSEDSTGHFGLNVEMLDTSESLQSLVMTGYPVGFVVSDGTNTITITEEGQQVDITTWNMDALSMTPPDNYNGDFFVTVTSVTLDEGDESSTEDESELLSDVPQEAAFVMNDDGSVLIEADDLLESQGLDSNATNVDTVNYSGEDGVLIDNENGTWTFWSDPDYGGPIGVDFTTDGSSTYTVDLEITALNNAQETTTTEEAVVEESPATIVTTEELLANVEGIEGENLSVSNLQSDNATITDLLDGTYSIEQNSDSEGAFDISYSVSNGTDTVDSSMTLNSTPATEEFDYNAAPGGSVNISVPTEISSNSDVDHMIISGLPDGVTPQSGIDQGDGEYLISGDLTQPITLNISESATADITMDMSGLNSMDQAVEGATGQVSIDVDPSYEMQGSSADNQQMITGSEDNSSGDWTTSDNTDLGVDVLDDSASFDDSSSTSSSEDAANEIDPAI
ncbi:MAG: tandem-95 repeat protein [Colwellia sp.]